MVDDKDQNKKDQNKDKDDEIVGLDEEESGKASFVGKLTGKLKKLVVPGAIALGAFGLSFLVFMLFFGKGSVPEEKSPEESQVQQEESEKKEPAEKTEGDSTTVDKEIAGKVDSGMQEEEEYSADDLARYEIDTNKIMQDLQYLFVTPSSGIEDIDFSPQDSIDTLNWFDKELAKLDKEKKEIEKRRKDLEKLEHKIDQAMIKINQAESVRIKNLARLYDGMKPQDIARLFANLSDDVVIALIPRMKPANASKILALLPPKRAARISTRMITVLEDK